MRKRCKTSFAFNTNIFIAALAGVLVWFYVTDGVLVIHTKTVITEYPEGMYESFDEFMEDNQPAPIE